MFSGHVFCEEPLTLDQHSLEQSTALCAMEWGVSPAHVAQARPQIQIISISRQKLSPSNYQHSTSRGIEHWLYVARSSVAATQQLWTALDTLSSGDNKIPLGCDVSESLFALHLHSVWRVPTAVTWMKLSTCWCNNHNYSSCFIPGWLQSNNYAHSKNPAPPAAWRPAARSWSLSWLLPSSRRCSPHLQMTGRLLPPRPRPAPANTWVFSVIVSPNRDEIQLAVPAVIILAPLHTSLCHSNERDSKQQILIVK